MRVFTILLCLTFPAHADLYVVTESTGAPEALQTMGNATGELTNLNGGLMTLTQGHANMNGVVMNANQANEQFSNGVNRAMNIEGALGSMLNSIGSMFHHPGQ